MRYFVRLDNDNQPIRLFRFDLTPTELHEALWWEGEWEPRFGIMFMGDPNYDEVSLETAQRLFPDAFDESMGKDASDPSTLQAVPKDGHVDTIMNPKKKKKKPEEPSKSEL